MPRTKENGRDYHQHDFSIEHPSVDLGPPMGHGAVEWRCSICGKTPEQVRAERTQEKDCRE